MDTKNMQSDEVALNEYFNSVSELDQEERDWKLHVQFVLSKIHLLSSLTEQQQPNPVTFRVFGSSAEDLKCFMPNDVGDIDIMMYPIAEEAIIDNSSIEYVDVMSPIYFRLRGKSHPLLQHCLAKNSEYVAASFLKDFHPKIFGDNFLNAIPKVFDKIDHISPGNVASGIVNNPSSPSCQIDINQSFGSLTKQVREEGNDVFDSFHQSDDFRNLLEWFAVSLNPSREFSEEHSECIDEYLEVAQRKMAKFKECPNVANYFKTLNDLMSSKELGALKEKVKGIDHKLGKDENLSSDLSENETVYNSEDDLAQESNTPEKTVEKGAHSIGIKSKLSSNIGESREAMKKEFYVETDVVDCGCSLPKVPPPSGLQDPHITKKIAQQLMDGIFGGSVSFENDTMERLSKTSDCVKIGIDLVPALKARGWPVSASEWPKRHGRVWPSPAIVSQILDSGFHMVVKTPRYIKPDEQLFRLSFSFAEFILSGELSDFQRDCYRCLKILYHFVVKQQETKILSSYLLKNVLFWTLEETDTSLWNEHNRACCVLLLLERLFKSLESKFLPHYFVPKYNLLEEAILYYPQELEQLAGEFRRVYENPMICSSNLHQSQKFKKEAISGKGSKDLNRRTNVLDDDRQCGEETTSRSNIASTEPSPRNETRNDEDNTMFLKHTDFLKMYKEICKELINLVLHDDHPTSIHDPTLTAIIDNLQKVTRKMQHPEAELMTILNYNNKKLYSCHIFCPGNSTRQRILAALKEDSKMFAYIAAQDDLLEVGKEDAIIERMMNSGTFDMSSIFSNFWDVTKQMMSVLDPPPLQSKQNRNGLDIPLD